jgi:hypothetical protein
MEQIYHYISEKIFHSQLSKLDYLCRTIAVGSGMTGAIILLSYMISFVTFIAVIGFFFMYCAAILNAIFLAILIIYYFFVKEESKKKDVLISIVVMLCNIPLAAICAGLGLLLLYIFKHI